MNRGNNPAGGLQRQTSGGSMGDSAPGTPQQSVVPQQITLQQSPVPQFMLATGPLPGVSLPASHQQRPQLLGALSQGLQVASPTQSPNTFPQGMITTYSPEPVAQSGGGQLRTTGVAVTQAVPAPSTPPVGMVANVLQHQLASPAGLVMVPSLPGSTSYPSTAFVAHPGGSGAAATFIVQQQPAVEVGGSNLAEFQILQQQQQVAVAFPSSPSVGTLSATGSTVHHLGQSPRRAGASPLASPAAQQSTLTKGMNFQQQKQQIVGVGASSPLKARASSHAVAQSPDRPLKRIKLEEQPAPSEEAARYRKLICDARLKEMADVKGFYIEHLTELFFLQNGGNVIDYFAWKKRPTMQLLHFLRSGHLDSEEEEEEQEQSINNEVKVLTSSGSSTPIATPVAISTTLPPAITALQQQQGVTDPGKKSGGRHGMIFGHVQPLLQLAPPTIVHTGHAPLLGPGLTSPAATHPLTETSQATEASTPTSTNGGLPPLSSALAQIMLETPPASSSAATLHKCATAPAAISNIALTSGSRTPGSPPRKQFDISAVCDTPLGSQEAIVERAKQEAQVIQRIAELRREGLWSTRRLPKVQEPPRSKAHWDYLLEEMQWLAADFAQERKWKKAGARKIARMVAKYHQEQHQKELRAEKDEAQRLHRIAANLAKMVKEFWSNVEKVVQYKQQSRLEEKRQKALDLHLSFIVDQTEKYSSWLSEGLVGGATGSSVDTSSRGGSVGTSPSHSAMEGDDGDFEPNKNDESDDEETIAKEEQQSGSDEDGTDKELEQLRKESELPIEELLQNLPPEVLASPAPLPSEEDVAETKQQRRQRKRPSEDKEQEDAQEFQSEGQTSEDDEETMQEQEKHERRVDHKQEIEMLEKESEMTVDELMKKYSGAYDSDFEAELEAAMSGDDEGTPDDTEEEDDDDEEEEVEEESDDEEEETIEEEEETEDIGMEYLIHPEKEEQPVKPPAGDAGAGNKHEITDYAAAAESIQPTGYTLETTRVKTPVPFLLKHTLREYQHVGLEWLATLYERKLNGILADEMGLGKTIQTIALLAHLACEHAIWGPHLIVVPTSVMLNWEMEFKKWCPAFKILTYFGNQKERKLKRQGWTKTNAFHVCITSYKLVIQDHQSFRRKKWKYFILDEAQNIKNFRSQRWQTLLNFSSQRRLLLTGTPLQNSLMELWSLMHFLMPQVFASHREFKEWFANPLTGMIEGSKEYSENLIRRLHKVLRPFLLRRLKKDVEKQMPKKYEHVIMCRLSKRQRFLYDDFMSQTKTKETLATGHFMSVINILMQLRKVCNHPNLFDPRPTVSPFQMTGLTYTTASLVLRALERDPLKYIDLTELHSCLADLELTLPAFAAHRIRKLQTPRQIIVELDSQPTPVSPLRHDDDAKPFVFRSHSPMSVASGRSSPFTPVPHQSGSPVLSGHSSPLVRSPTITPTPPTAMSTQATGAISLTSAIATVMTTPAAVTTTQVEQLPGYRPTATTKVTASLQQVCSVSAATTTTAGGQQRYPMLTSQPITVQIQNTPQGPRLMIPSGQLSQLPGFFQVVQTSTGQQIVTSQLTSQSLVCTAQATQVVAGQATSAATMVTLTSKPATVTITSKAKPVVRVSPMVTTSKTTATSTPAGATKSGTTTTTEALSGPLSVPAVEDIPVITKKPVEERSPLFMEVLAVKRAHRRAQLLARLARINEAHCSAQPVWGSDLHHTVDVLDPRHEAMTARVPGYVQCACIHTSDNSDPKVFWQQTHALRHLVHTPHQYLSELKEILDRFMIAIPSVVAPSISLHTSHPPPHLVTQQRHLALSLCHQLKPLVAPLHRIQSSMRIHCPEVRLIQYDCGKLQVMDSLLRKLKSGDHRALIFTQMTRMLDVLEAFLNYHGYRYVRLDGTTKVEQRQILMERFNMDRRIFCFILSTRSGGIGVNLTGADTVIFYDSDWNPTMDAQAQDRCHRIGQTRDVHIYRLISEKTVEENILKKANQKRMLGDVAIEGGNFTTAFFKQNTILDLFEEPSGLDALAKEKQAAKKSEVPHEAQSAMEPPKRKRVCRESIAAAATPTSGTSGGGDAGAAANANLTEEQLEQALCAAEDETDIQATKVLRAEQKAELAEFDEDIPWDEKEAEQHRDGPVSKVEQELAMLDKELTPVERYAVTFMENELAPLTTEELQKAEEEVSLAKEEWELSRLKVLKQEEERRAEIEEDEMLFTYSRDDAYSQVYQCDHTADHMLMWTPPTPPQDDHDLYIDECVSFLYEPSVMPESQLPPVYVKKEHKRIRVDPAMTRKIKVRKEEQPRVPRSLFNRPMSALRRDASKLVKLKHHALLKPFKPQPLSAVNRPLMDTSHDQPEWLIHEDWALLQVVQTLLGLPLNLTTSSPAHIPNWDLVAEVVNATSHTYISAKQCKYRYENVIVPREEGRILYDINPRKQKKSKGIYKTKNNRPMRTSQLFLQDNYASLTKQHSDRFEACKAIAAKRTPTLRPTLANPMLKNPKHAAVLAESGINYEQPLSPIQVAANRADRIAKEKRQNQAVAEQQLAQQRAQQQVAAAAAAAGATSQVAIMQGQQVVTTATTIQPVGSVAIQKAVSGPLVTASVARNLSVAAGSIVVNTVTGGLTANNTFTTISRRGNQTFAPTVASNSSLVQRARTATGAVGAAELGAAILTPEQARLGSQVISTMTPQLIATQKTAGGAIQQKALTPVQLQQIQAIRQQQQSLAKFRQQQSEQLKQQQLKRGQQVAGQQVVAGLTTVQKSITAPLVTNVAQVQAAQAARLQVPKQTVKPSTLQRHPSSDVTAVLLKRKQLQQQAQKTPGGATLQTPPQIQHVSLAQLTSGQLTRLTTAQIIAGTQQLTGHSGATTQAVPTLVKTMAAGQQGGTTVPIPMSAVSLGISVSVPQQKAIAGKATMTQQQQIRHIQLLQQRKPTAIQLEQQKVATLTGHVQKVATPGGSGPLIIQQQHQQQQQTLQKAMVQQIQDLLKQQHRQQGGATIQQVIAATPQQQSSGATVIGTQIMSSQVAAAKASVPVATASSVLSQQVNAARSVTPIMVTAVPSGGNSLATVITTQAMMAGTVNITLAAPSSGSGGETATLLKEVQQQEVLVSPQKGLTTVVGGVAKTLHAVPQQQAVTVRHISGATLTQGSVAATAQALTPQHTIIKQQALAGKQSTIVGGQQVALRQAVGVQPSQQQLAAAIVRQHGISVQQPQTVTVHQSPGGATTRPVSIAVQQGLRPGVTVRQAVAMAPSVVSVQQSAVRPAGAATVQHVQTVRPPHTVTIQKSQTAAMQQVLQEVQQQAQAQAQQRHQVSSASVTPVSSASAAVVTQVTVPQSPTVVTVSQAAPESTADSAAATTTAQQQQQLGNKSYAMRLRNQRS